MIGIRRARALLAAGVVAAGLAVAAPGAVLADTGTGCSGSATLAAGQTAQCSFTFIGPNSSGSWTWGVGGSNWSTTGDAAEFRLEAPGGPLGTIQDLGDCESVDGACGEGSSSDAAPVPSGTVVACVAENFGPVTATVSWSCASGQ